MFEIMEKERIASGVHRAVINAPEIARAHHPGQFIILRTHEDGERIPLTIADKDLDKGTITLVWQEVGVTTYYMGTMCVDPNSGSPVKPEATRYNGSARSWSLLASDLGVTSGS